MSRSSNVATSGRKVHISDMISPLRSVLVRAPGPEFAVERPEKWNYAGVPDLNEARKEHARLVEILESEGVEVYLHDGPFPGLADSIFVFDPSLMTEAGAVILRMGKELRRGEEGALAATFERLGIGVLGRLTRDARAEGGDLLRLDRHTIFAGRGFRTNGEGIRQLSQILQPRGIEVVPVDLPYFRGPGPCLHLLSLISPVGSTTAVVYAPLLPVRLWEELKQREFGLIEVDDEEFATMATNILVLRPGLCLMLEGNRRTRARLEERGIEVVTYKGDELSLKAEGGPTCLTLPLLRTCEDLQSQIN